jgi:1,4-dihydroxy-2-naphthoate polyprenyltransferase
MNSTEQKTSPSWQIWLMAARPRTLPASAAGVITGSALALYDGRFHLLEAFIALLVALCLQTGSNLANDVFDYERGVDAKREHGPQRVTQSGLLTPAQVKAGTWIVFVLAALLGTYLALESGWIVFLVGLSAIVSAVAYSAGPFPLGYHGLGELFVFLFFGLISVTGTYFVQVKTFSPAAAWMSLPMGLIIVSILVVNNLRDIETDRAAGKFTLPARFGPRFAKTEYIFCLSLAFLSLPLLVATHIIPAWGLLTWVSLPLAWRNLRVVSTQVGKSLNPALAGTSQLALIFSVLFFIGMLLARLNI